MIIQYEVRILRSVSRDWSALSMTIKVRPLVWKKDFELVRVFLAETYNLTQSFQNWIPSKFENIKFDPCGQPYRDEEDDYIKIWEEVDESEKPSTSTVVAVTFMKSSGECWIQIHPHCRPIEKELVLWIEERRRGMKADGNLELELLFRVDENDMKRKTLLAGLGYEDRGLEEYGRVRPIGVPIPQCQLPEGFAIRHVDLRKDFMQYREVQAAVFPHCRGMTKKILRAYGSASFYNAELDLVAVAPEGRFASFVTVRMDPLIRIAEFEPVGTHPKYRRLGLAKALTCEGC
jgi:hypothetical protein